MTWLRIDVTVKNDNATSVSLKNKTEFAKAATKSMFKSLR